MYNVIVNNEFKIFEIGKPKFTTKRNVLKCNTNIAVIHQFRSQKPDR